MANVSHNQMVYIHIYIYIICHLSVICFGHMAQAMACHGLPTVVPVVRRRRCEPLRQSGRSSTEGVPGYFDDAMPGANRPAVEFTKP